MIKEISAKKNTWNKTWSKEDKIFFDKNILKIFSEITKNVNFKNQETLEFGAGTGRLSYLLLKNGAKKVNLLDYSKEGEKLSKMFFKNSDRFSYKVIDLFKFKSKKKYDIVFSSGLIEHFQGKKFDECVKRHFELSNDIVFFVVPASPHYNDIRVKTKKSLDRYGWQKPKTLKDMVDIAKKNHAKLLANKRFHSFYGIRFLGILHLPELIEKMTGGLIISVFKKNK